MEMLPVIKVVPEMNLTLDPSTGLIGASLGRDVVLLSMDEINVELDKMEAAADDFMNSLDPYTVSVDSFSGREGTYVTAATLTNITYGVVIGLMFMVAIILF